MTGVYHVSPQLGSAFRNAEVSRTPFPHCVVPRLFDDETALSVLAWFQATSSWALEGTSFYVQHAAYDLAHSMSTSAAGVVCSPEVIAAIREFLEDVFAVEFDRTKLNICAHRLLPGHRIGIHNDSPAGGTETHRLVVHFTDAFHDSFGGHLALFSRKDPAGSLKIVSPVHNSAVGMEFSSDSWHFVDEIKTGVRYTLLYSFWARGSQSLSSPSLSHRVAGTGQPVSQLDQLQCVLREMGVATVPHSGRTLLEHLIGTYEILVRWNCVQDACLAGLFHSVFGTPSAPGLLLSENQREAIRSLIGDKALSLVHVFGSMDSHALEHLCATGMCVENASPVTLHDHDRSSLVSLYWANLLEQAPRSTAPAREKARLRKLLTQSRTWLSDLARVELERMLID